jgi:site-specific DNA-methyltransferase (adenine-specific)
MGPAPGAHRGEGFGYGSGRGAVAHDYVGADGKETVEAFECATGCPVAMLDAQSGERPGMSGGGRHAEGYGGGMFGGIDSTSTARGDTGGASRFFYCTKASRFEREFGCGANCHPTLKPIDLARYLASLILPPAHCSRRILVPFAGSGSEMIGAMRAGWSEIVGIEREAEHVEVARARLARWAQVPANVEPSEAKADEPLPGQTSLFGAGQ